MNNRDYKRYVRIDRLIKSLEAQKKKLREEILNHGEEETDRYTVKIAEFERSQIAAIDDIKDRSMKVYDALMKLGLIRSIKQQRVTVKEKI